MPLEAFIYKAFRASKKGETKNSAFKRKIQAKESNSPGGEKGISNQKASYLDKI